MSTYNNHGRLNILDVHRKLNQKQEKKSVCYEKVLQICQKRIVALAERDKTCCMYEFPEYVVGYPLFDLNACMEYCKTSLIASGFWVEYYFPNKFYISWDFAEIKQKKQDAKKQIPLSALSSLTMKPSVEPPTYTKTLQPQQPQQQAHRQQLQPSTPSVVSQPTMPTHSPYIPTSLQNKITNPLPTQPLKYNPFDVYVTPEENKTNVTNNTFFPKNPLSTNAKQLQPNIPNDNVKTMMNLLTSSIGSQKNIFDYKPSGKLALNI